MAEKLDHSTTVPPLRINERVRILGKRCGCDKAHKSDSIFSITSGITVTLKTERWEVPSSKLVALVDLAVRSFTLFSPKLP